MRALDQKALALRRQRAQTPSHAVASAGAAPESCEKTPDSRSISSSSGLGNDIQQPQTAETSTTPQTSRLKQQSTQVGEEAASILASVRKSSQKPTATVTARHDNHTADDNKAASITPPLMDHPTSLKTAPRTASNSEPSRQTRQSTTTLRKPTDSTDETPSLPPSLPSTAPINTTQNTEDKPRASISARSQRVQELMGRLPTSASISLASSSNTAVANNPPSSSNTTASTFAARQKQPVMAKAQTDTPEISSSSTRQQLESLSAKASGRPPPARPATTSSQPEDSTHHSASFNSKSDDRQATGEEEEEIMAEDAEPLVQNALIDVTCFQIKQTVMLRANTTASTLLLPPTASQASELALVDAHGPGLGSLHETWVLYVMGDPSNESPTLRYGDTICLCSCSTNHFLGVKPAERDGFVYFQAGCFRPNPGKAERWTVLRADTHGKPIRVGKAAVETQANTCRRMTEPIKSGDGILLRSCQMGGILSVLPGGSIRVVADSYDADTIRHGRSEEATLLGRLQRHGKLMPSARETIHMIHATSPPLPSWLLGGVGDRRPYLDGTGAHLHARQRHDQSLVLHRTEAKLSSNRALVDAQAQEQMIINELLGCLMGLEGQYIRAVTSETAERVDQALSFRLFDGPDVIFDKGVRNIVEGLLPLVTWTLGVQAFLSSHFDHRYGHVMHALCERLDSIVQECLEYIGSLDIASVGQSLRKLQLDLRPTLDRMVVLYQAIHAVRRYTGGALLNVLHRLTEGPFLGNSVAEQVAFDLLATAAAPYMCMLSLWVEFGEIDDPYGEFMVRRSEADHHGDRFELVDSHVLEKFFSTKASIDKLLNTGRYWSMVYMDSSGNVRSSSRATTCLSYDCEATELMAYVDQSYSKASEVLVHSLLQEHDLMQSLKLVKRYFLLDQGDFFVNFMDAAGTELLRNLDQLSRGQIEHWFNISVQLTERTDERGPSEGRTGRKSRLSPSKFRCRFASEKLTEALDTLLIPTESSEVSKATAGLTGMDAFVITVPQVPFPASLVLHPSSMFQYQLLFRQLFFAKHVERSLVGIWQDHQKMTALLQSSPIRGLIGPTFLLRTRMLHFVQSLIYYMVVETIDANWADMETSLSAASGQTQQTIDNILCIHEAFLKKTLEACLLVDRDFLRCLSKILKTCLSFSEQMNRFMVATGITSDKTEVAVAKRRAVQRNLNDRAGMRASLSVKRLEESMKAERSARRKLLQEQSIRVKLELTSASYRSMVSRFDEVFTENLLEFTAELKRAGNGMHMPRAMNLAFRLDYSGTEKGSHESILSH